MPYYGTCYKCGGPCANAAPGSSGLCGRCQKEETEKAEEVWQKIASLAEGIRYHVSKRPADMVKVKDNFDQLADLMTKLFQ